MANIQPQAPQESGVFGSIGKKIIGAISNWPAEIIANTKANRASEQAAAVGQELANKTGKPQNVVTSADDAVAAAKKTTPTAPATSPVVPTANAATMTQAQLQAAHAASVKQFGNTPNAPVVVSATPAPTPKTSAPASGTSTVVPPATTSAPTSSGTTSPVTTGDTSTTPPAAPPAGASTADTQAFYDAHPMYLRPGESIDAYNARVTPLGGSAASGGTPSTYDASGDYISPADQNTIADNMANGMSATDLGSAGAAMSAFGAASAATGGTETGSLETEITSEMDDIMNDFSTPPPSLLTAYNNLLASSGINADQLKLAQLSVFMDGTEDDVRAELTNNGGFATESQIQALTNARNTNLSRQYNLLQSGLAVKQNYVDNQMKYTQADEATVSNNFEEKYTLIDNLQGTLAKLQSTDATAYYRFQTQQMNQLNTILKFGGTLSDAQIASYSASTGIDMTTLKNAMSSADARYALATQIDNSNLALKNMQISGGGISVSKISSLSVSGVPPTVSTAIAKQYAQGTSASDIKTSLETQYGTTQGDSYFESFNDVMGTNKNLTATNIDPNTKAQLLSDIGTGKYSAAQLIAAYPEVDSTYITTLIAGAAQ